MHALYVHVYARPIAYRCDHMTCTYDDRNDATQGRLCQVIDPWAKLHVGASQPTGYDASPCRNLLMIIAACRVGRCAVGKRHAA